MAPQQIRTDMLPMANIADYVQLQQARHANAPVYNLSQATIATMPPLPAIDWTTFKGAAPQPIDTPGYVKTDPLPVADVVIITWTNAEWAALHHVFCDSSTPMSYNAIAQPGSWDGDWLLYARDFSSVLGELTAHSPSAKIKAWGRFRMLNISGKKVMLFKSDMHVHTDGAQMPLIQMITQIIADVAPNFIITVGTAGGARVEDNLGTTNVTNAARFQLSGEFVNKTFNYTTFNNAWTIADPTLHSIDSLLMETPITTAHVTELLTAINNPKGKPATNYTLTNVMNKQTAPGLIPPLVNNITSTPVLTTNGYDTATTTGNYEKYAAMEMDDAVIAMQADASGIPFAVIRNISDPVENVGISSILQRSWGGTIYNTYGFYTSFNSALAACVCV